MVFSTKIQEELEKKARSPKSWCFCPEMKNDQDQMTEERGAVPKTSYAGGKFDPKKNVRGGDRKIRGTDADRKAISRAEMKSRAEKERDDATPSTSKAAWKELEAEKGAKPATQSDLSAAKSSHGTSKLSLSTVKDQLAKEKATSEARLKELEAEKSSHDTTKLNLSTTKDQLEAVQAKLNQLKLKKAKKSGK